MLPSIKGSNRSQLLLNNQQVQKDRFKLIFNDPNRQIPKISYCNTSINKQLSNSFGSQNKPKIDKSHQNSSLYKKVKWIIQTQDQLFEQRNKSVLLSSKYKSNDTGNDPYQMSIDHKEQSKCNQKSALSLYAAQLLTNATNQIKKVEVRSKSPKQRCERYSNSLKRKYIKCIAKVKKTRMEEPQIKVYSPYFQDEDSNYIDSPIDNHFQQQQHQLRVISKPIKQYENSSSFVPKRGYSLIGVNSLSKIVPTVRQSKRSLNSDLDQIYNADS